MSQEMPCLRRFLALVFWGDNRMTIFLGKVKIELNNKKIYE